MSRKIYPDVIKTQMLFSLPASASVREAVVLMADKSVGAIFVMDQEQLQGIFTERDVVLRVVQPNLDPNTTTLNQVMTHNPYTIDADANAFEALQIMQKHHFRHIPVLLNGHVIGMVSVRDLFSVVKEQLENDLREAEEFVYGSGYSF